MPIPLALAAGLAGLGGFAKSGGLGGIIGSGARKREEQRAEVAQREAEHNYFNFDFNQDVGPIANPFTEAIQEQQAFAQRNIDRAGANQVQALQQANRFGATTAVIGSQAQATERANQGLTQLRAQGAQYVDQQRQQRIAQRYNQAGTALARSENRLAQAKRARQQATQAIFKGIGGGLTASAGAASAGPGASFKDYLSASGLGPANIQKQNTDYQKLFMDFLESQNDFKL